MTRHAQPPVRTSPYEGPHRDSLARRGDRVRYRPAKLADYLHWLQDGYAAEAPARLHDRDTADDGTPDMTGQAKRFLGFTQKGEGANDWDELAKDRDKQSGYYLTPMRAAIERLPVERRQFVKDLATNLFTPGAVATIHGIPEWCAGDVMYRCLTMLWDVYSDAPIPRRTPNHLEKSESQRAAEAAA